MLPNKTSSMEGCSAAVTETESPSQLRPAVNQTICTSLTGEGWRENLEVEAILEPPNGLKKQMPGRCRSRSTNNRGNRSSFDHALPHVGNPLPPTGSQRPR